MQVASSGRSAMRSWLIAACIGRERAVKSTHALQWQRIHYANGTQSQHGSQDGQQDSAHNSKEHQDRPKEEHSKDSKDDDKDNGQDVMLAKFMESGFLQAMKLLRDRLLEDEWRAHGKHSAKIMAIAQFEELCATEGLLASSTSQQRGSGSQQGRSNDGAQDSNSREQQTQQAPKPGWHPTYQTFTQLYDDPDNLTVVEDDVLRSRLRSMVAQVSNEREQEAFRDATARAEDMAKLLKEGPTSLAEMVRNFIPLPPMLKGG